MRPRPTGLRRLWLLVVIWVRHHILGLKTWEHRCYLDGTEDSV